MVVELDNDVFDAIVRAGAYNEYNANYVTARRGTGSATISLLIPVRAVKPAVGYVVTDNEGGTDGESDPVHPGSSPVATRGSPVEARGVAPYGLGAQYGDHLGRHQDNAQRADRHIG